MRVVRASRIRNPFIEQSCTVITLRTSLVVLVVEKACPFHPGRSAQHTEYLV